MCAVSAPVFGPAGDVLAVLTVVAPVRAVRRRRPGEERRGGQEKAAEMTPISAARSIADRVRSA